MAEIRVYDIEYDRDGETAALPDEFTFDAERFGDPDFEIADAIHAEIGWVVNGFRWERVEAAPTP